MVDGLSDNVRQTVWWQTLKVVNTAVGDSVSKYFVSWQSSDLSRAVEYLVMAHQN